MANDKLDKKDQNERLEDSICLMWTGEWDELKFNKLISDIASFLNNNIEEYNIVGNDIEEIKKKVHYRINHNLIGR